MWQIIIFRESHQLLTRPVSLGHMMKFLGIQVITIQPEFNMIWLEKWAKAHYSNEGPGSHKQTMNRPQNAQKGPNDSSLLFGP